MALIVLSRLEGSVSSNVRKRGQEYARSGSVQLQEILSPATFVAARVQGSGLYQVMLRYNHRVLMAACTCPYFDDQFELCKHIWATVIVCEAKQVAFPGPIDAIEADEFLPEEEDAFDEDGEERFDVDEDDHDDSGPDWHSNIVPLRAAPMYRSPQAVRSPWVEPSRWRTQVHATTVGIQPVHVTPPLPEITWVVDPASSGATLYLEVTTRPHKKNGELGKPQALRIEPSAVSRIESPVDREILSILTSSQYSYYAYGSSVARLSVGWPLAEYVLPKIAATGRLWIRVGKGEYETGVTFDAGDPWRLAVRAEEQGGKYVLVASLQRGEVSVPITDALAVTRGGLVIFHNSIARFADDRSQTWASLLRREEVEIPAAELDDFVKAVASSHAPVRIDFPSTLGWQEQRGSPHAKIKLRNQGYGFVEGVPTFEYDGHVVSALAQTRALYDDKTRTIFVRDAAEESRLLEALWGHDLDRQGDSVGMQESRRHRLVRCRRYGQLREGTRGPPASSQRIAQRRDGRSSRRRTDGHGALRMARATRTVPRRRVGRE